MKLARETRPWRGAALALGLAAAGLACRAREERPRWNLVLVSLDTCRADRLSCYGAARPNTPNVDALAEEAVVFEDCLAQSALTAPSHMSMLTGQFVHRHGLLSNQGARIPSESLAGVLRDLGWRTAAFTGHGSFQAKHGLDHGFETFQSHAGDEDDAPPTRNLDEVLPHAVDWLAGAQEPFFLLVHAYDPHCPFWAPDPWRQRYTGWYGGDLDLRDLCHPKRFREKIEAGEIGREELRYVNDMYDAEVASADAAFGTFLDVLRERGLLERSIVVFTSDHGEVLGNHGWVGHGQVWEEALRVPLLVRFPGGRWSGLLSEPVQHVDLVPTLLSALGLPSPPGVQGIDLMPLVRGETVELPEDRMRVARVGAEVNQVAVRFGQRWKAAFQERSDGVYLPRLYDLREDPFEQQDLMEMEEGRERFERIVRRYLAWREATREEDAFFLGEPGDGLSSEEDLETLRALGYVDD